jgi:hypothetical protein
MKKMSKKQEAAYCRRLNREPKPTSPMEAAPCPFCGDQPYTEFWHGGGPRKTMVHCLSSDCAIGPSVVASTRARALDLWNIRREPRG